MKTLEVFFTPADFAGLKRRNLDDAVCVVFDIFRATSTMITALANGAAAVIPVEEIADALAIRQRDPAVLLAGEREGIRIRAAQTGGVDFDFGNSPREFTKERVAGRTIVTTTTNGTRALQACRHARRVLVGSFLNLRATAEAVQRENRANASKLLVVCSGTFEQAALEDVLAAGALCELTWNLGVESGIQTDISDSARMARSLFQSSRNQLPDAAANSRNGRRLQSIPELRDDVPFCLQLDVMNFAAALDANGKVTRVQP